MMKDDPELLDACARDPGYETLSDEEWEAMDFATICDWWLLLWLIISYNLKI